MTHDTPGTGISNTNPFDQLLSDCQENPTKIQARYETHRSTRNAQFKEKLLHQDFPGWQVDETLKKLLANGDGDGDSDFTDTRHNLTFYARPPKHIKDLIAKIQLELRDIAPTLWFYPPESLHITTIEVASSRPKSDIDLLATHLLETGTAQTLVDYTFYHRARLIKPMLSFDAAALAVSFVPAAVAAVHGDGEEEEADTYTYHHLRRDLAARVLETGVQMASRYIVPSAHVTIARFVTQDGFLGSSASGGGEGEGGAVDGGRVAALVERIERLNEMLRERYWPGGVSSSRGEWVVGQGEGLEFCKGASWYGGGERVLVGRGF